jgi:hypothetical protein
MAFLAPSLLMQDEVARHQQDWPEVWCGGSSNLHNEVSSMCRAQIDTCVLDVETNTCTDIKVRLFTPDLQSVAAEAFGQECYGKEPSGICLNPKSWVAKLKNLRMFRCRIEAYPPVVPGRNVSVVVKGIAPSYCEYKKYVVPLMIFGAIFGLAALIWLGFVLSPFFGSAIFTIRSILVDLDFKLRDVVLDNWTKGFNDRIASIVAIVFLCLAAILFGCAFPIAQEQSKYESIEDSLCAGAPYLMAPKGRDPNWNEQYNFMAFTRLIDTETGQITSTAVKLISTDIRAVTVGDEAAGCPSALGWFSFLNTSSAFPCKLIAEVDEWERRTSVYNESYVGIAGWRCQPKRLTYPLFGFSAVFLFISFLFLAQTKMGRQCTAYIGQHIGIILAVGVLPLCLIYKAIVKGNHYWQKKRETLWRDAKDAKEKEEPPAQEISIQYTQC